MGSAALQKSQKTPPASSSEFALDSNKGMTLVESQPAVPQAPQRPYALADLRPGKLLLLEFSRPGIKNDEKTIPEEVEEEDGSDGETIYKKSKKADPIDVHIQKACQRIVNMAYQTMLTRFPGTPWGFFCEPDQVEGAFAALKDVQDCACFTNEFAIDQKNPRRVRIDIYPMQWDHEDPLFRRRIAEQLATRLIELRKTYTNKIPGTCRAALNKARLQHLLVTGKQNELVQRALKSTNDQRPIMAAIYSDRDPRSDWVDLKTGRIKDEIRLDFGPIDDAIRAFYPAWDPTTLDR